MNVFRLDDDPKLAARYHCDRHVSKLLLEAVQVMNTALDKRGLDEYTFYKSTHENHPISKWVAESWGNFIWTMNLVGHLNDEKKRRFESGNHSSFTKMYDEWFESGECILPMTPEPLTEQYLAMPEEYHSADPVRSYRDYYAYEKAPNDWFGYDKNREMPNWLSGRLKYGESL